MNTTVILRSIMTSTARLEERADGVIVQRVMVTRTQTLTDARENTAAFARLAGGRPRPALVDIRIMRAIHTDAREHYVNPEFTTSCSAVALLVASPGSHQLSQYYMSQGPHSFKVRQFVDPIEAIAWLREVTAEPTQLGDSAPL